MSVGAVADNPAGGVFIADGASCVAFLLSPTVREIRSRAFQNHLEPSSRRSSLIGSRGLSIMMRRVPAEAGLEEGGGRGERIRTNQRSVDV